MEEIEIMKMEKDLIRVEAMYDTWATSKAAELEKLQRQFAKFRRDTKGVLGGQLEQDMEVLGARILNEWKRLDKVIEDDEKRHLESLSKHRQ